MLGGLESSEARVAMTLLSIAKVRYEFQQVSTPVPETALAKEEFLEVPDEASKLNRGKKISGRSIYVGDRDAFFKYIAANHTDIEEQLVPKES